MLINPSTCSCLEIRMQDNVTLKRLIIFFFKFREFKYLEITVTNQNSNKEDVRNTLN